MLQGEIKYETAKEGSIKVHEDIRDREFISFGVVLTVWEVLPTFMVVWFFRVRRPNVGDMVSFWHKSSINCYRLYIVY